MPQLDTIYILTVYLWTWLTLHLTMKKIKTFHMTNPTMKPTTTNKPMYTLLWL
uniref:ATP synthase F0 subunit 8 n=1 Tax=Gonyosoma frenatum TaxID=1240247 RepID=A0A891GRW4_9SAUR|nr:ATP synthase F0 subunit 8 [Gonyosoma frenatum]QRK25747.1 ATP synthase F0 subunit 8 [Gonyosoma frenatum]